MELWNYKIEVKVETSSELKSNVIYEYKKQSIKHELNFKKMQT